MVEVNRNLYVRGSRNGETGYQLDGMSVFNPWLNSNGVPLIPEAIDQIDAHTGAYGAELGSFGGGIVNMRMKTGGEKLEYFFNIQTDDVGSPGSSFGIGNFKAVNYGYRNVVGTIGGPLPYIPIRFFLAGQSNYRRSRQPMFFTPFRYDNLVTDLYGSRQAGIPLPGPIDFRRNYIGTNWERSLTLQGNAAVELAGLNLKLLGSYDDKELTEGSLWPQVFSDYYRQKREMLNRQVTKYLNLQAQYAASPDLDLNLSLAYYDRFARTYDPDFKNNWRLYSDSLANARAGYPGFTSRYRGPYGYSVVSGFMFSDPSYPNNSYSKERQRSFSLDAGMRWRLSDEWSFSAGGRMEFWTLRSYSIGNIGSLLEYMDVNRDGRWDRTFTSKQERRVYMIRNGAISAIGYQYDDPSKTVDDGEDPPAEPFFGSAYVQSVYSTKDLVLLLGARFEHISPKFATVPETINPTTGQYDWQWPPIDQNLDAFHQNDLVPSDPTNLVLPRLGVIVPLNPRLVLHAAYGDYVQMNALNKLYISNVTLAGLMSPLSRVPYNLGGTPVTFTARPERSSQVEIGATNRFASGTFDVSFFQKTMRNQLQLGRIYNSMGIPIFVGLVNEGKGVARGIETSLRLHFLGRIHLQAFYSYSDVQGLFDDATSDWQYVSDDQRPRAPEYLVPLSFDETHRGSLLAGVEFLEEDGPVLNGLAMDAVVTMNSGHRYTPLEPPVNIGCCSVWYIGVRPFRDYRTAVPTGDENSAMTPIFMNVDIRIRKRFEVAPFRLSASLIVLNLFNRQNILNVFPTTGSTYDDGWLLSPGASWYTAIPGYADFYRNINQEHRWAYMTVTGNDFFGTPRQIRLELEIGL